MKIIEVKKLYLYAVIEETETEYICMPTAFGETCPKYSKTEAEVVADFDIFYERYENKWDYTYNVYERGLTLRWFIEERHPEFSWMFTQMMPQHISEIPEEIRAEYIDYLAESLAADWETTVANMNYTDLDAARGDYEDYLVEQACSKENDIAQLKKLIAEGEELERQGYDVGMLNVINKELLEELENG